MDLRIFDRDRSLGRRIAPCLERCDLPRQLPAQPCSRGHDLEHLLTIVGALAAKAHDRFAADLGPMIRFDDLLEPQRNQNTQGNDPEVNAEIRERANVPRKVDFPWRLRLGRRAL
jgi:hypothetical protein